MDRRILVPGENGPADETILTHVARLAKLCGAEVVVIHVADGWVARNIEQLNLRESEEMKEDRAYLERVVAGLRGGGVKAEAVLAAGDPAKEIGAAAEREGCGLMGLATRGHRLLGDVVGRRTGAAVGPLITIP